MKETPLSTCERNFITQAIKQNQRLDGRTNDEFRAVQLNFGADWGSVMVTLGETKVLGQVSCELGQPKATRPNEGMMYINVELGPMAAAHLEAGRNSELNVQLNRTLERTFKDSRCVDLESLCVTAEERVWMLRVDLNVLNHGGNLIDCCSIATLCALAHFKRPDVSIVDDEVHIHTDAQKEPIPIVLHHYPVCVSYCTFDEGRIAVADPTAIEERTAEASMIFGLNSFRELCCLNLGGTTLTSSLLLLQSAKKAARRAKFVVDLVKQSLEEDAAVRESGHDVGFTECLRTNKITALAEDRLALRLRHFSFKNIHEGTYEETQHEGVLNQQSMEATYESDSEEPEQKRVISIDAESTILNSNQSNIRWIPEAEDDENVVILDSDNETDDDDNDSLDAEAMQRAKRQSNQPISKQRQPHPLSMKNVHDEGNSDSEEEEKMVL